MASKDDIRRVDYEGLNGETSWILVADHLQEPSMVIVVFRKRRQMEWIRHFLTTYSPTCSGKYIYRDQGGELWCNLEIQN